MATISTTATVGQQSDPIKPNRFGPFLVNGAWYVVAPYYYNSYGLALAVFKASDPTSTWAEQDSPHHPLSTNTGSGKSADTLYSLDVVVRGTDLHMIWMYYNPAVGQYWPFYCKYSCATDTWTITQENVGGVNNAAGGYQWTLAVRSDGSVVAAGATSGIHWYTRASGGGWTDQGALTALSAPQVIQAVTGASDRVHFFYASSGNNWLINHRSVESNNVLNTEQASIGGGTNGYGPISAIAYLDGATTRLRVGCQWAANSYMAVLKADEGATPTWTVEEGGTTYVMAGPVALAHDGTTLYHVHTHTSDGSVTGQYQSSINNGGSWTPAGDTALNVSTGYTIYAHAATVYQRAGYVCLGYVYGGTANAPPLTFVEVQLRSASASASDTWSVSDTASRQVLGQPRTAADSWSVSDTASAGAVSRPRSTSDSWSVSSAVTRVSSRSVTTGDSWSVSDVAARGAVGRPRTASDSWSISDIATGVRGKSTADSWSVSDAVIRALAGSRSTADAWAVSDSASRTAGQTRAASDSWSVSDSSLKQVNPHDSWTVSDVVSRFVFRSRTIGDTWAVSDSVSRTAGRARSTADSFTVADSLISHPGVGRTSVDSWSVSDSTALTGMTPKMRQMWRISAGRESAAAQAGMGNGSLFTLKNSSPTSGSFVYGILAWAQSLDEAHADGGIRTWDLNMASTCRETGLFNEAAL